MEKITIKIDKIVLIAASEIPRNLKVASLQLTGIVLLRDSITVSYTHLTLPTKRIV